jgi:hypothetical protein
MDRIKIIFETFIVGSQVNGKFQNYSKKMHHNLNAA